MQQLMGSGVDSGFGVAHAEAMAIDDLAELIRGLGEGRAFVVVERSAGEIARGYVESALATAGMSGRIIEVSNAVHRPFEQADIANQLATFAGGALVTVGGSAVIKAGKSIAALATNRALMSSPFAGPLAHAPRKHVAIPVGLGPAEEATSLVTVGGRARPAIVDDRIAALSLLDARLFPDADDTCDHYAARAIALAGCTVSDDSTSLRDVTLALSAAHELVNPDRGPADVRLALTLATASHRRWPLCRRCRAGSALPTMDLDDSTGSPAWSCFHRALAKGLNMRSAS